MEKRTDTQGTAQQEAGTNPLQQGVGGRQAYTHPLSGGGGYLQTCSSFKLRAAGPEKTRDPRLEDLRRLGLHHTWQKVAAEIGVDAFLAMWRILDGEEQFHKSSQEHRLEFSLRSYKSFLRYQRNEFIRQLSANKVEPNQIRQRLIDQMGEELDTWTIKRIIKGIISGGRG